MTQRVRAREGEEVWETVTDGKVYLRFTDQRGREQVKGFGGKTGTRIRIPTVDREVNQDAIIGGSDPFTNGMLRRIDADQNADERTASDQVYSTEELMAFFAKSGNAFQSQVRRLNERNVRRMREMAEHVDASASQIAFLDRYIIDNYRVQGSMPSYDELVQDEGAPAPA